MGNCIAGAKLLQQQQEYATQCTRGCWYADVEEDMHEDHDMAGASHPAPDAVGSASAAVVHVL